MTSQRKIAANRANCRKSSGPRTTAGKQTVSRNARKHGLAGLACQPAAVIEPLARLFCNGEDDAVLLTQARIIAADELVLQAVRAQKLFVVERLRDPSAIALAKGDNSLAIAECRFEEAKRAERELNAFIGALCEKYKDHLPSAADLGRQFGTADVAAVVRELLEEAGLGGDAAPATEPAVQEPPERDQYQALEEAVADLARLARYERRAWSRQKRAIRTFMELRRLVTEQHGEKKDGKI